MLAHCPRWWLLRRPPLTLFGCHTAGQPWRRQGSGGAHTASAQLLLVCTLGSEYICFTRSVGLLFTWGLGLFEGIGSVANQLRPKLGPVGLT